MFQHCQRVGNLITGALNNAVHHVRAEGHKFISFYCHVLLSLNKVDYYYYYYYYVTEDKFTL